MRYRNLKVRLLPEDLPAAGEAPVADDGDRQVLELSRNNFPIVDFHAHLKGGLTIDEVLAHTFGFPGIRKLRNSLARPISPILLSFRLSDRASARPRCGG